MPIGRVLMTADAVGGVWTYSVTLARELARTGVAVDLATMGPPPDAQQRAEAERIPGLRLHTAGYRLEWAEGADADVDAAGDWLRALADERRPDVVHINGYAHAAVPFAAPRIVTAHSCVLSWWRAVHGTPAPAAWSAYATRVRRGLDAADHVVAPTAAMLRALVSCHGPVASWSVIANGAPAPVRAVTGPRKQDCVLAAGRLWDAAKNLQALAAVAPRVGWPIHVAGAVARDGADADEQATAAAACAAAGLTPLGRLDGPAMAAAYARAAIYAFPARYEPFGLSVLEAARAGCALVLGDIDSLRENWEGAALFVHPDDHDGLADLIGQLTSAPRLRAVLGDAARRRAAQFTARRMAGRYLTLYEALAGTRAGRADAAIAQGGADCVS